MMRTLLLVVAVSSSACLTEGAPCDKEGLILCDEVDPSGLGLKKQSSLWCSGGAIARFACPGPAGCANGVCDFRGTANNAPCPRTAIGSGYCVQTDLQGSKHDFVSCNGTTFQSTSCDNCTHPNSGPSGVCRP